jgi:hypothetical protein
MKAAVSRHVVDDRLRWCPHEGRECGLSSGGHVAITSNWRRCERSAGWTHKFPGGTESFVDRVIEGERLYTNRESF